MIKSCITQYIYIYNIYIYIQYIYTIYICIYTVLTTAIPAVWYMRPCSISIINSREPLGYGRNVMGIQGPRSVIIFLSYSYYKLGVPNSGVHILGP